MNNLRILLVTSEWPTADDPNRVPFLVQHVAQLRATGANVEVFGFRGSKSPVNYAKAWKQLRRTHDLRQFDIVHGHFGQSGVVAWPCPSPLVMTFHGSDLQGVVGPDGRYTRSSVILRRISRFAARRADENIVVSRRLLEFLPKMRRAPHVMPLGVDFERFTPVESSFARHRLGLPEDKKLVLFAANPANPVKRYELAKQAVAELASPDVELVPLSGVAHDLVPLYMSACDALILTSLHEGSPTVVKEALVCNLPVVSVDVGDVRERLAPFSECPVCEPTAASLADGLRAVLNSIQPLGSRRVLGELDERQVVNRVMQVYENALARRGIVP